MLTGIFDTHAHYDDSAFDADREEVLDGLGKKGVAGAVNCAVNLESSRRCLELAERPGFYAAVGIHPSDCAEYGPGALAELEKLARRPKAAAIGEIGLDYHYGKEDRDLQIRAFRDQLALALRLSLPAVIHCRDACGDMLEILRDWPGRAVWHCFSESAETARLLCARGFYLGFGGTVTFKNARRAVEAAASVPLSLILLETDCPYLAPEPYRGSRCTSDMIESTARKIAGIRGMDPQELVDRCAENAARLFSAGPAADRLTEGEK